MRKRNRVIASSLLGASLSLGAICVGAASAGASPTTSSPQPVVSSLLPTSLLPTSIPSVPALPAVPSLCATLLANTALCGPGASVAAVQEVSSVQNWLQGVTTMLSEKIPTIP